MAHKSGAIGVILISTQNYLLQSDILSMWTWAQNISLGCEVEEIFWKNDLFLLELIFGPTKLFLDQPNYFWTNQIIFGPTKLFLEDNLIFLIKVSTFLAGSNLNYFMITLWWFFCRRCKLYRFHMDEEDGPTWKERGVGELKVMKHETKQNYRIIMRRDKTLKICANHNSEFLCEFFQTFAIINL